MTHPSVLLGTSSFTADGWQSSFYPKGMKPVDYLSYYAEHFHTVEVDSTFYGCPTARTVNNWMLKTPPGFIFSVKVPSIVTHEKILVDCDAEFEEFVGRLAILKDKLGPVVFQFPFFDLWKFPRQEDFLAVLVPFLKRLPDGHRFAIEIRNKSWLDARFADALRVHKVALVLQDLSHMPGPTELARKFDPITAEWTYIRWLGDRKGIEKLTLTWGKTVVDRSAELATWVDYCHQITKRGVKIYAYANNHYAGYAPATIEQFRKLWQIGGGAKLERPAGKSAEKTLFDP